MFDVGFLEILVIGIVSLIVIGPERLPAVARTVGTWVGKAQRFVRGVKSDFASELRKTVEENDDTSSPSDSSGSGENASVPSAQESTATSAQESTPSSETKPASTDADKKSD